MSEFGSILLYVGVAFLSATFFFYSKSNNKVVRLLGLVMCILIPAVFAGIRFNVGTDYANYFWTFENLKKVSFKWIITDFHHFNMDRGFLLLSKFFLLFFNSKTVFGLWGAIILLFVVITLDSQDIFNDTTFIYLTFIFLYYYNSFNILRQVVAASIVLFSIKYIFKNKPVLFLLFIAIASTIHMSALIAAPIWFLWNHKKNTSISVTKKWLFLILAFIIATFWQRLLQYILSLNIFSSLKFFGYLSGNEHSNLSFFVKLGLTIIFIVIQPVIQQNEERVNFYILLFTVGMLLDYTGFFSSFVKRSAMYYSLSEIFIFSRLSLLFTDNSKKIGKCLIMLLIVVYFTLSAYILKQGELVPFTI